MLDQLIATIETTRVSVPLQCQLRSTYPSPEGMNNVLQIPLSGEVSKDTEKTLNIKGLVLEERSPEFVALVRRVYGAMYPNCPQDEEVIPVKLVIRGNSLGQYEPGVAIDGVVFSTRGADEEVYGCMQDIIETDKYYCKI